MKSIIAFIAAIFLLLTGISACSPKIKGWAQESFRDPGFKNEDLYNQKLAIFPVLVLETLMEKPEKTVDFSSGERPYTPDTRKLEVTGEQKTTKEQRKLPDRL